MKNKIPKCTKSTSGKHSWSKSRGHEFADCAWCEMVDDAKILKKGEYEDYNP